MRAASSNGPSRRYRSSNRSAASWSENTSHTPSQAKINMGHSPHWLKSVSVTYGVAGIGKIIKIVYINEQ